MKVLVACEFSGIVRDAFIERGHEAISCDLLPSERPGPHIQGDVRPLLRKPWDLVIAHPPCTYLSNAGWNWFGRDEGRALAFFEGLRFFRACLRANTERLAVENPLPHKVARLGMGEFDQIVRPWWFGHPSNKATCLWLKGLGPLVAAKVVPRSVWTRPTKKGWKGSTASSRSCTYEGIARAMAEQWG